MVDRKLKVFIGFDRREPLAYEVAKYTLLKRTEKPENIEVYPVKQHYMRELGIYSRKKDKQGSTEFTLTRFWVPYLSGYDGWALFTDCDFIFMGDILRIFDYTKDESLPVYVCKHEYTPRPLEAKMDNQKQHVYPKKNWSSCMLFNCAHPALRVLHPSIMNRDDIEPRWFHRFEWLPNENLIGSLPLTFNWLAGETEYSRESFERYVQNHDAPYVIYQNVKHPLVYHYTLGAAPIFGIASDEYKNREKYPYLYDLMTAEVNDIFVKEACELKGKKWHEIEEEERKHLMEVLKTYEVG